MKRMRHINKRVGLLLGVLLCVALMLLYLAESPSYSLPSTETPICLYANQCHHNLKRVVLQALKSAHTKIALTMYALQDPDVLQALNAQADAGLDVEIVFDAEASPSLKHLGPTIKKHAIKDKGLMHKKILCIDSTTTWIGSANCTHESLALHENLILALHHPKTALALEAHATHFIHTLGEQTIEYYSLPEEGPAALSHLIHSLGQAQKSLYIAMYTWTHPRLTEAVIQAAERGVDVRVVLDASQARGASKTTLETLQTSGIACRISDTAGLCHHKFAWIDEKVLIMGSANWTRAAFAKNHDCLLFLDNLNPLCQKQLEKLWKATYALTLKERRYWRPPCQLPSASLRATHSAR